MNVASYHTPPSSSTLKTPAALGRFIAHVVASQPEIKVWLFRGSLGAGKTTAIRAVLKNLGVRRTVVSPTYTLAQLYRLPGGKTALHVDAYRIRDEAEWAALGIDEAINDAGAVIFVEWPEKMRGYRWGTHGLIKISIQPRGRLVKWSVIPKRRVGRRRSKSRR